MTDDTPRAQIAARLEQRVTLRRKDAADLRPLVGQLATCDFRLTVTGAIAAAEEEANLLRVLQAELARADAEVQELLTLLDLVEVEHTQDTPQVKFYDDPVQFAREMAARFAVDRDKKKHEMRALQEKLDAEVGRLTRDVQTVGHDLDDAMAEVLRLTRAHQKETAMELPDIEIVSAQVHETWMQSKAAQGVTSRKSESGEELMVPYPALSEPAKELDRGTVRAVYAAIERAAATL